MTASTWTDKKKPWLSEEVVAGLMRISDCLVVTAAGAVAYLNAPPVTQDPPALLLLLIALLLLPQVSSIFDLYSSTPRLHPARPVRVLLSWLCVMAFIATVQLLQGPEEEIRSVWLVVWFVYGFAGLAFTHFVYERWIREWYRHGPLTRRIVIAGTIAEAASVAQYLHATTDDSVRVLGLFCNDAADMFPDAAALPYPILGDSDDLVSFTRGQAVDAIVLALPWHAEASLRVWIDRLRSVPVDVLLCPPAFSTPHGKWGVSSMAGLHFLKVSERPLSGWGYIAKAVEDRLLALVLLIVFGPLMLGIAALVRADSPGPALFRQKRYGFNNRVIEVFKFRTMCEDADRDSGMVAQAQRVDPRITRIGYWLRKTSLDELPQLFNVLRGEMSLVGPRPHAISHNELYAKLVNAYLARHRVKPGITGWAQVNGFRGETDTVEKMEKRVKCDLYYIENWSVAFDFYILFRTTLVGFVHPNAY